MTFVGSSSVRVRTPELRLVEVTEIGDAALVLAVRDGDRKAEERLVVRYAPMLGAIVARLLGSRSEAEDVVQDAFLTAFSQLHRLRDPGAFKPWLIRIAIMQARQLIRRRRIARALGLDTLVPDVTLEATAAPSATGEMRAEFALLDRVLDRLPTDARIAWMLRHVEGLELEEVADACGCSLATIKRRIHSASEKIREHVALVSEEDAR